MGPNVWTKWKNVIIMLKLVCTFWKVKCSISFEVEKPYIEWLLMYGNDYKMHFVGSSSLGIIKKGGGGG